MLRYIGTSKQINIAKTILNSARATSFTQYRYSTSSSGGNDSNSSGTLSFILPDGRNIEGKPNQPTTPLSIASRLSKSLTKSAIVAVVNGKPISLNTELKQGGSLEILEFSHEEARRCYWYTASIMLASAINQHFNKGVITAHQANITTSPLLDGFQSDISLDKGESIKETDLNTLKLIMDEYVKQNIPILREPISKQEALELFKGNEYIKEFIEKEKKELVLIKFGDFKTIATEDQTTLPSTAMVKVIKLLRNSGIVGAHASMSNIQRVAGIAFPTTKQMQEFNEQRELAAQNDHRVIGRDQELFFFHPYSPGSCFFLPHGAHIYNKLLDFLRSEYRKRGYTEVITPNIYSQKLWETSGHWQNYKDNMFSFTCDHTTYSLKPMNCPGHCLMYAHTSRSYRDLPIRLADFGALHRNEVHGSLSGLTRVRRFQQDDAHIFCTNEQIEQEMGGCLDFMEFVYQKFGFTFDLELSTRPEQYLGELEVWNEAERALETALNKRYQGKWKRSEGEGSFYGPKIDIHIKDANGRSHQCATIQLDFQLPIRFELEYKSTDNNVNLRPVMIHRAIFGSTERMLAILIEHTKGRWPLWLSPRQVTIATVSEHHNQYANQVAQRLKSAGYQVFVDDDDKKVVSRKIRDALVSKFNYIAVVGDSEVNSNTINIRGREDPTTRSMSITEFITKLDTECSNYQ